MYEHSRTGKDRIVEEFDEETDSLLFPWAGQWSTDVFTLGKEDLAKHYNPQSSL